MGESTACVSKKAPVRLVNVDGAEFGEDGLGARLDGVFRADIEGVGFGCATSGGDLGGYGVELLEVSCGERDGGTLGGEGESAGTADALRCSGDEGDFSGESAH
jgi:hypothetical protein